MSRALVLVAVLGLTAGCSCAASVGLLGLGVAGSVVLHDPGHVVGPAVDCAACLVHEVRRW